MCLTKTIFRLFFQGLAALFPLIVIGYVVGGLVHLAVRASVAVLSVMPDAIRSSHGVAIAFLVIVVVLIVALISTFGWLLTTSLGGVIMRITDRLMGSIPVARWVYGTTKQVVNLLSGNAAIDAHWLRPVLVEYPSEGIWVLAVCTGSIEIPSGPGSAKPLHTVFIPTSPNPTSGVTCIVPASRIRETSLSIEQMGRIVLTAGTVKN